MTRREARNFIVELAEQLDRREEHDKATDLMDAMEALSCSQQLPTTANYYQQTAGGEIYESLEEGKSYVITKRKGQLVLEAGSIQTRLKPTPDPETGLVPCGCGGELELRKRPAMLQETKMQYWVVCRKCHWSTMDYLSKELAVQHANRAMDVIGGSK
jgi:hypothetical protein